MQIHPVVAREDPAEASGDFVGNGFQRHPGDQVHRYFWAQVIEDVLQIQQALDLLGGSEEAIHAAGNEILQCRGQAPARAGIEAGGEHHCLDARVDQDGCQRIFHAGHHHEVVVEGISVLALFNDFFLETLNLFSRPVIHQEDFNHGDIELALGYAGCSGLQRVRFSSFVSLKIYVLGQCPEGLVRLVHQLHGVFVLSAGHQPGYFVEVFNAGIRPVRFNGRQQA